MSVSRRDFMKLFGVGMASLLLTRCRPSDLMITPTCYTQVPVNLDPQTINDSQDPRERLRYYWLSFQELARQTASAATEGETSNTFSEQLIAEHRLALDELVAASEITPKVAELIQEAYEAAIYHVWRSNTFITCYEVALVDYFPASAQILVQQTEMLQEMAAQATIDPETLAKAQAALEHDMAFYALTDEEVSALYARIMSEWQSQGQNAPVFEDVELEITSDAKTAAQFIINLLTGE